MSLKRLQGAQDGKGGGIVHGDGKKACLTARRGGFGERVEILFAFELEFVAAVSIFYSSHCESA